MTGPMYGRRGAEPRAPRAGKSGGMVYIGSFQYSVFSIPFI
jgi:hypothetical protein